MAGTGGHLLCSEDRWVPGDSILRESRVGMGDFCGLISTTGRQWYCVLGQSCCTYNPGNIWPASSQTRGPVQVSLSLKWALFLWRCLTVGVLLGVCFFLFSFDEFCPLWDQQHQPHCYSDPEQELIQALVSSCALSLQRKGKQLEAAATFHQAHLQSREGRIGCHNYLLFFCTALRFHGHLHPSSISRFKEQTLISVSPTRLLCALLPGLVSCSSCKDLEARRWRFDHFDHLQITVRSLKLN